MLSTMLRLTAVVAFLVGNSFCQPTIPEEQKFTITTASDGTPLTSGEYVNVTLVPLANSNDLKVTISAPFYDDPDQPLSDQPTRNLWKGEVVELYFLNDNEQYLQIQISPQGNYWVGFFNERRNDIRSSDLNLTVATTIEAGQWRSDGLIIPGIYFPPKVTKFNLAASSKSQNKYIALFPSKTKIPDFHNTPDFGVIKLGNKPDEDSTSYSPMWQEALEREIRKEITKTWTGIQVPSNETVRISLKSKGKDVELWLKSPFYNNPPAQSEPGKNFKKLEKYEVVEFFFLNNNNQYLQIQLNPLGDYKVLLFDGERNLIARDFNLTAYTYLQNSTWIGKTVIPGTFFPPQAVKFSATAIHEVEGQRRYLTLNPTPNPQEEPDFHNTAYFGPLNLHDKANEDISALSEDWTKAMNKHQKFTIDKSFKGEVIPVEEQVEVALKVLQPDTGALDVWLRSPFYNDTPGDTEPGENPKVYLQEVVELYFVNSKDQYFQLQLSPYNQYLGFIYNGERNLLQYGQLPMNVSTRIRGSYWIGEATIPANYLPPQVSKFGASAMHGEGKQKQFLTANPPTAKVDKPNFHNIQDFKPLQIASKLEEDITSLSPVWTNAIKSEMRFTLNQTWNGTVISESERVEVSLRTRGQPPRLTYWIKSPFYNDTITKEKVSRLWRQETLELFFANEDGQYVQLMFTPQEDYNVFLYNGSRNYVGSGLPLTFYHFVNGGNWVVDGTVPTGYLPPKVTKFNAAAQHGEGPNRVFLSLVPSPLQATEPDFHNIKEFLPVSLTEINNENVNFSPYWISAFKREMNFTIEHTWDGEPLPENQTVHLTLQGSEDSGDITLKIASPFYNDPPPSGNPGVPFDKLWEYEVVEAFFLNDDNQYLEVEIAPGGQHIVLLLNGERNLVKKLLPLNVSTEIDNSTSWWTGEAVIPADYFPANVTRFNAYAIHGVEPDRQYMALYPTDGTTAQPDFHNLTFFQRIYLKTLSPLYKNGTETSKLWQDAINQSASSQS